MRNWIKKLGSTITYMLVGGILFTGISVYAVNVTVPQSTGLGVMLRGNANGTYTPVATSTLGLIAAPAGTTTQVQYNDNGVLGASSNFTWNDTTTILTVGDGANDAIIQAPSNSSLYLLSGAGGITLDAGSGYIFINSRSAVGQARFDFSAVAGSPIYTFPDTTGTICLTTTCSGSGNTAWTIGPALIYNATSTDSVLIGTTTPTSAKLYIVSSGIKNPLVVASSSGGSFLTVAANGSTTLSSLGTGVVRSNAGALFNGLVGLTTDVSGVLGLTNGGIATTTKGNLTVVSSNLSITGGQQVLIGTSTAITLTDTPTFTNATHTGISSLASTTLVGTFSVSGQTILANASTTNLSVTTNAYLSNIASGNCLQTGTGGLISSAGAACGSSSGNSAWTIGSGKIYNATSTDLVGIGTTGPNSTLTVWGKGGTNPFKIASSTGTQLVVVDQQGRVGIGNVSPSYVLDISNSASGISDVVNLYNSASAAIGNGSAFVFSADTSGVGGGLNVANAKIGSVLTTSAAGSAVSDLFFQTTNGGAIAEKMRLTGAGLLGIGTTTPGNALTVIGSISSSNLTSGNCVQAGAGGVLTTAAAACGSGGGGSGNSAFTIGNGLIYNATSTDLVGIGTITPTTTLFIQGKGGTNPFAVASSSGSSIMALDSSGGLVLNSTNHTLPVPILTLSGVGTGLQSGIILIQSNGSQNLSFGFNPALSDNQIVFSGNLLLSPPDATHGTVIAPNYTVQNTANAALQVYGQATQPTLDIASSSGVSQLRITNNGNVGIGTTTPTALLALPLGTTAANGINFGDATANLYRSAAGRLTTDGSLTVTSGLTASQDLSTSLIGKVTIGNSTRLGVLDGNNRQALLIANTGEVGIGTTSALSSFMVQGIAGSQPVLELASSTGTSLLRVLANGNVGINTSTPAYAFVVAGKVQLPGLTTSAGLQTAVVCLNAANEVISDSVACLASARRFKTDVHPLAVGLNELLQLNPVEFKWTKTFNQGFENDPNKNGVQYSLIADEVQKIDPKLVTVETSGKDKGLVHGLADLNHWVALFVQSFKDMEQQITGIMFRQNSQDVKIQSLEKELKTQQAEIDHMKLQINMLLKK